MPTLDPAGDEHVLDVDLEEDRYARLRLIHWWDQERLANARVIVIGAGALGNEICKNLALLGVGRVFLVDMDTIEDTNLTRSVLFRHTDRGKAKAQVAAAAMMDLNPDVRVQPFVGNVVYDLGQGVFQDADLVLGGLDNREARVHINAVAWKLGRPWIDGAIEVVQGVARMFVPPEGPCYECTMSALDYKLLNMRRSCSLLTRDDVVQGKVPTTPTTASLIAGIQVQEAVKWLHRDRDLPTLAGKGFVFNGLTHDSFEVEYQRREDCPAHDQIEQLIPTGFSAHTVTLGEMLDSVRSQVAPKAVLEFDREICTHFACSACETVESVFKPLGRLSGEDAACPWCDATREVSMTHVITGSESYLDRTLADFGVPAYDILRGRDGMNEKHFLLDADRECVLGCFA